MTAEPASPSPPSPPGAAPVSPLPCPMCGAATRERLAGLRFIARSGYRRCSGCGLLFAPCDPDRDRRFYEQVYPLLPHKAREAGARRPLFVDALDRLERSMGGRRLLDVGCGQGEFLALARARGWDVTGTEVSSIQAETARARSGARVVVGTPEDARSHGPFDLVTLWNVLDQVPDPVALARSAGSVLDDDGRLLARVPNGAFHRPLMYLVALLGPSSASVGLATLTPLHPWILRASDVERVLRGAGLDDIRVRGAALTRGDSSRPEGSARGQAVALGKRVTAAIARSLERVSGGRWLVGPSLEAEARRGARR